MKINHTLFRKICLLSVDMLAVVFAGLVVTGGYAYGNHDISLLVWLRGIMILVVVYLAGFVIGRLYDTLWRYANSKEFLNCVVVTTLTGVVYTIIACCVYSFMPVVFDMLTSLLITIEVISIRLIYRYLRIVRMSKIQKQENKKMNPLMIVGAGASADILLRDMKINPHQNYHPVCVVDDDPEKIGRFFHGIVVEGNIDQIPDICEDRGIETIFVCIPSATKEQQKRIYGKCMETKCKTYIIPNIIAFAQETKPIMKHLREINIEDLLGRERVSLENCEAKETFQDKVILVTGAGGSIGSELVRQLAKMKPKKLVLIDIYENGVYEVQQELKFKYGTSLDLDTEIASIRDREKIDRLFEKYKPQVVLHAAAHKHVPLMEACPAEAVKNNIFGTKNVAEMAVKHGVERFLLISTDKAVNPTSVMGATKRFTEMLIQMLDRNSNTRFVAVRFGNVIGSNGSVVPLFQKQLQQGGPLTVTHKDIIRYFMTIPEAVQLVLEATCIAKGGEIFILDMGQPVRILDVAEQMIRLSGLEPYKDIDIKIVGLRPGEKLYEELRLSEEGTLKTENSKIFIATIQSPSDAEMEKNIQLLRSVLQENNEEHLMRAIQKAVPTFHPQMKYHK